MKSWFFGLLFIVLGGVNAGVVFSTLESRLLAGMIAGGVFILVGIYVVAWSVSLSGNLLLKPSFYAGAIHLFLISLPMVVLRIMNSDLPFEQVEIWGMPGPFFHKVSEKVYGVMFMAVIFDGLLAWFQSRSGQGIKKPEV